MLSGVKCTGRLGWVALVFDVMNSAVEILPMRLETAALHTQPITALPEPWVELNACKQSSAGS
jgi:hypothetical protein